MKKVLVLLVSILMLGLFVSCQDDCTQDAYCQSVSSLSAKSEGKVYVCHNGNTLEIDEKSLQDHLDHGDTEEECQTLSYQGLVYKDGEIVKISCDYKLPFTYTDQNTGKTWIYTEPK
jgi:hypothetical protein